MNIQEYILILVNPICCTIPYGKLDKHILNLGFNETVNPVFVDEEDIYKQFGPEAPAVLDRCFFLAGLPRPDIGIGMDKIEVIEEIGVLLTKIKFRHLKIFSEAIKKVMKVETILYTMFR